jgi:RNA-directed DNA polymerase
MLEAIMDRRNIEKALVQVIQNKGSAGVDGMQTDELRDFLNASYQELCRMAGEGMYQPSPVRKVEIPKPQGGKRTLGIPTVLDRLLQQAISQWLSQFYEPYFSKHSYGFRPNRNTHQAVKHVQTLLNEGRTWVIELDLEKFFDKVNHDKLMSLLSLKVKDKGTLQLIHQYLRSGIMEGGLVSQRTEGTPQGSPLSPLLSNIILDEFDKELAGRGHNFVRYADDCSIYVKSEKAAHRVLQSVTQYLEQSLLLKVNKEKTKVSRPVNSYLLGFSFYKNKGEWQIRIAEKSQNRIKEKCKAVTKRNNGLSAKQRLEKLAPIIQGWVNYFLIAKAKSTLVSLDKYVRTRLRAGIWRDWKNGKTRVANLIKFGAKRHKAYEWGNTSKGYCRAAHSPILCTTLTNEYFLKQGYVGFYLHYQRLTEMQPSLF